MKLKTVIYYVIGLSLLTKYSKGQEFGALYRIDTFESSLYIAKQPNNPFELNDSTWVFMKFRRNGKLRLFYTIKSKYYLDKRIEIGLIEDYKILTPSTIKEVLCENDETGELKKVKRLYNNTEKVKSFQKKKSFRRKYFFLERISNATNDDHTKDFLK